MNFQITNRKTGNRASLENARRMETRNEPDLCAWREARGSWLSLVMQPGELQPVKQQPVKLQSVELQPTRQPSAKMKANGSLSFR